VARRAGAGCADGGEAPGGQRRGEAGEGPAGAGLPSRTPLLLEPREGGARGPGGRGAAPWSRSRRVPGGR
jgi:hypothetical protein